MMLLLHGTPSTKEGKQQAWNRTSEQYTTGTTLGATPQLFVVLPCVLYLLTAQGHDAGKTLTAPLDRVKLLLQTRGGLQAGALKDAARGGGLVDALKAIGREEGFFGYWKGNVPQVSLPALHLRL